MDYQPYPYQRYAEQWIINHPHCGLFLEMGLGKTVITLTAIQDLIYNRFEVEKVLVVAPLRVAHTVWAEECQKWGHLKELTVSKVLGDASQRMAALERKADIYVINRENLVWLVGVMSGRWPFDMLVLDELSSFKSASSERFKALRSVRRLCKRIVGLTGTPSPNGLIDLWSQVYLLDGGEALGKTLGGYREKYFTPGARNGCIVYDWRPKPEAQEAIYQKLEPICMSMKAEDYLHLPERRDIVIPVTIPMEEYTEMERNLVLPLADTTITAASAAVVVGKLLQMAGGAVYDEEKQVHTLHDKKLDALDDLIEAANGEPVLIYYAYQHEMQRIMKRHPEAKVLKSAQDVIDWNAGKIPVLMAHPDSAGHGLNLQNGGHILIWYGLTWSLEKYQQACARLHRQGQKKPVTIYHLVSQGTVDEDVMRVLDKKAVNQDGLMAAVKARLDKYV